MDQKIAVLRQVTQAVLDAALGFGAPCRLDGNDSDILAAQGVRQLLQPHGRGDQPPERHRRDPAGSAEHGWGQQPDLGFLEFGVLEFRWF